GANAPGSPELISESHLDEEGVPRYHPTPQEHGHHRRPRRACAPLRGRGNLVLATGCGPGRPVPARVRTGAGRAGRTFRGVGSMPDPRVAVVIPIFKQPSLVIDALESVLRQQTSFDYRVVAVNDGCPFAETDQVCRSYARAFPDRVLYVRRKNGG